MELTKENLEKVLLDQLKSNTLELEYWSDAYLKTPTAYNKAVVLCLKMRIIELKETALSFNIKLQ